jgi:inner membrane protein
MASAFTHTIVALAAGRIAFPERRPLRIWMLGIVCALLPDVDVIAFRYGVPYGHWLGHRGFSHSLLFALLAGIAVTLLAFRSELRFSKRWWLLTAYFTVVTASHGVLDAMTDGGYGTAFFSPFDDHRFFLPWRPLTVAPIGVRGFFSRWGWDVLMSELLWIWLPLLMLLVLIQLVRRARSSSSSTSSDGL